MNARTQGHRIFMPSAPSTSVREVTVLAANLQLVLLPFAGLVQSRLAHRDTANRGQDVRRETSLSGRQGLGELGAETPMKAVIHRPMATARTGD